MLLKSVRFSPTIVIIIINIIIIINSSFECVSRSSCEPVWGLFLLIFIFIFCYRHAYVLCMYTCVCVCVCDSTFECIRSMCIVFTLLSAVRLLTLTHIASAGIYCALSNGIFNSLASM